MKTYPFENFHEVDAAVVFCIDPRFWPQTIQFIQSELGITRFDPYTYPGGPLCLARPETQEIYLNNIKAASIDLHHAPKVILISHAQCGGYRLVEHVEGEEAIIKQIEDLNHVAETISEKLSIPVDKYLMKIVSDQEIIFEKIQ